MLRIHFTEADLARTTVAPDLDALWEIVLSGFRIQEDDRDLIFQPWFQQVRAAPALRPGAQLLATLAPKGPYFPDFLTPLAGQGGLDAGLDAVLSTPRMELRTQLSKLDEYAPVPGWLRPLADGDRNTLALLENGLRAYHRAAIEPYEELIQGAIDADRARRAHHFLAAGIEGVLTGIPPVLRWSPPVLEVRHAVDQDLYLRGRGLRLVPSFFCGGTACCLADPDLPPVLIYPIDMDCRWSQAADTVGQPLDALIGATRATILRSINLGANTTQLARRANISPGSVSRHTATLRESGLITTHRDGSSVVHTLTPLGMALLEGRAR